MIVLFIPDLIPLHGANNPNGQNSKYLSANRQIPFAKTRIVIANARARVIVTRNRTSSVNGAVRADFFDLGECVVMICNHDDVAEWDGEPRGQEQRLAQADGDYAQGEETPRCGTGKCRQNT